MLAKLALGNIRRTLHDYAIYAITLVLGVAVFYAFNTIAVQADFLQGNVKETLAGIRDILLEITVMLALAMGFLMVYANNFLLRRRTKELGLYQVLGMRVGQVNLILVLETLVVAVFSLAVGIVLGALLSQLMVFVTAGLFQTNVSHFRFFFSTDALLLTVGCFVLMFLVMMLFNTHVLNHVRLVDLMSGSHRNEKSPVRRLPVSIALFAVGLGLIVTAYLRLSVQGIPGFGSDMSSNIGDFILTTIMVSVGTVAFFLGLAGVATALLSRSKRFWWRDLHLFTVRQLAARVNTTSLSMAVVAMVLFLAITSVTTGMILVRAVNAETEGEIPFDASIIGIGFGDETVTQAPDLAASMRSAGIDPGKLGDFAQINLRYGVSLDEDGVATGEGFQQFTLNTIARATGQTIPQSAEDYADGAMPLVLSISDYNANRRLAGMEPLSLDANHYLLLAYEGTDSFFDGVLATGYRFTVADRSLTPAQPTAIVDASRNLVDGFGTMSPFVLIVSDDVAAQCSLYEPMINIRYTGNSPGADAWFGKEADEKISDAAGFSVLVYTASRLKQESATTTGLVIYLAIYIGFVLVVACAAILAIQQLSAASDATHNYRVLGELGCSERLIYGSLRAQIVVSFALPLVVALAHSLCALRVVQKPLAAMGYTNLATGSWLTVLIFVFAYGGYLAFTYRAAHGVVRSGLRSVRRTL